KGCFCCCRRSRRHCRRQSPYRKIDAHSVRHLCFQTLGACKSCGVRSASGECVQDIPPHLCSTDVCVYNLRSGNLPSRHSLLPC
ncbi:hypothetical protein BDR04DRAFT_1227614, partial [Suillus decipiens]